MFESKLADTFKEIFKVKKVSYDQPGESLEQYCLWIEIEKADLRVKDGRVVGRVEGQTMLRGTSESMPFGFFAKAIREAEPALTKDLFFSDIESNSRSFKNIVQRGFSFVYLFNSQYDPKIGTITSVILNVEEH